MKYNINDKIIIDKKAKCNIKDPPKRSTKSSKIKKIQRYIQGFKFFFNSTTRINT